MEDIEKLYVYDTKEDDSVHTHDQWKNKFHQKHLHI